MSSGSPTRAPALRVVPVPGLPEVRPGDDLAALLVQALAGAGLQLAEGDVVAVASKVVAKAEGRFLTDAAGRPLDHAAAVADQTESVVAQRLTPRGLARIVRSRSGPVLAAAGVDASNLPPGSALLALPTDPDASARSLRSALRRATGLTRLGVVVTDTLGRPWRTGQVDTALGAAGLVVHEDLSGVPDAQGRPMEVTDRALADEVAAAADLVKGKVDGVPVAVLSGLGRWATDDDGPGAAALHRPLAQDWFRLGHAEAARAALGVGPEHPDVPVQPVVPQPVSDRIGRAVAVALAAPDPLSPAGAARPDVRVDGATVRIRSGDHTPSGWVALGALAQRVLVAAWAEDVALEVTADPDGALTLRPAPASASASASASAPAPARPVSER